MKVDDNSFGGNKGIELADYVARELDGADPDRGSLEELTATVENMRLAFGRLVDALAESGSLPLWEVPRILTGYGSGSISQSHDNT